MRRAANIVTDCDINKISDQLHGKLVKLGTIGNIEKIDQKKAPQWRDYGTHVWTQMLPWGVQQAWPMATNPCTNPMASPMANILCHCPTQKMPTTKTGVAIARVFSSVLLILHCVNSSSSSVSPFPCIYSVIYSFHPFFGSRCLVLLSFHSILRISFRMLRILSSLRLMGCNGRQFQTFSLYLACR